MKNMKFGFFGALAITAAMFFAGCSDPCKDIACVKGDCVEGLCVCQSGYEGVLCDAALNAKFTGSYTLSENCTSGPDSYAVTFTPKSTSTFDVSISGLYKDAAVVTGVVAADGLSFTVAKTQIGNSLDLEVTSGTATATGTSITVTYKIYATGTSTLLDQCTGTLTK